MPMPARTLKTSLRFMLESFAHERPKSLGPPWASQFLHEPELTGSFRNGLRRDPQCSCTKPFITTPFLFCSTDELCCAPAIPSPIGINTVLATTAIFFLLRCLPITAPHTGTT